MGMKSGLRQKKMHKLVCHDTLLGLGTETLKKKKRFFNYCVSDHIKSFKLKFITKKKISKISILSN